MTLQRNLFLLIAAAFTALFLFVGCDTSSEWEDFEFSMTYSEYKAQYTADAQAMLDDATSKVDEIIDGIITAEASYLWQDLGDAEGEYTTDSGVKFSVEFEPGETGYTDYEISVDIKFQDGTYTNEDGNAYNYEGTYHDITYLCSYVPAEDGLFDSMEFTLFVDSETNVCRFTYDYPVSFQVPDVSGYFQDPESATISFSMIVENGHSML